MKKFIFIMPLMAVSLLASCGGGSKIPDLPKGLDLYKKEIRYGEDGKTIYGHSTYEYDKNLMVGQEDFSADGIKFNIFEYAYDEHGNMKEKNVLNKSIGGDNTYHTYTNTYDSQNRLTKVVEKISFDQEIWYEGSTDEYIYDKHSITHNLYIIAELLKQAEVYTYDDRGCLINEKTFYVSDKGNARLDNWEKVYTVDNNGCATKVERFIISPSGERGDLTEVSEITYLNNLWYRPLKIVTTYYDAGTVTGYDTTVREYDNKNQITLLKNFNGTDEETSSGYSYYYTFEY